jgi:hypothetical protein
MPDQDHGLADIQRLQQTGEIQGGGSGGDGLRHHGGAQAVAAAIVDQHPGKPVRRFEEGRRPRSHVVAEAAEQDRERFRTGMEAVAEPGGLATRLLAGALCRRRPG